MNGVLEVDDSDVLCSARPALASFAVEVRGGHAAVHEEVAAGDEDAVGASW
jgi:hypothetical protein